MELRVKTGDAFSGGSPAGRRSKRLGTGSYDAEAVEDNKSVAGRTKERDSGSGLPWRSGMM